ncbi:hypothetical protein P168DRAFT_319960 [Aspergillus campestris IBT 28561]|uniref:Uncharacterized protein n=1 Tax=Aspergillus campestris (strain IBT 28561) TaxID=1392248 RepID=A0A2I1D0M5_ASPC2|nr:uncharacterized protein P168DRAFT_319960 [Aspergillus campestris IBT 28561]PKY03433.1 hypothetical protein P168DRAFT_319960 [Aspergillus campestris IBT 28561]
MVDITRVGQTTIHVTEPPSVEHPKITLWLESVYVLRVPLRGALYDLSAAGRGNTCGVVIVDDEWPMDYHPMDFRPDAMASARTFSAPRLELAEAYEQCVTCSEQNMLLAMAARQIGDLCGKTADCYTSLHQRGHGEPDASPAKPRRSHSADLVDISVSTCRVNRRERLYLLGSLVTLQTFEFQRSIDTIKSRHQSNQR